MLRLRRLRPRVGARASRASDARVRRDRCGRDQRPGARSGVDRGRGGGSLHRKHVKVLEDVLDATARSRCEPRRLRPRGRDRGQPDERPRRGEDDAARADAARARRRARGGARGRRAVHPRRRPDRASPRAGHPDQHGPRLRRRVPPRREHGAVCAALSSARAARPARDRERREPRLPGRVPDRRGRTA